MSSTCGEYPLVTKATILRLFDGRRIPKEARAAGGWPPLPLGEPEYVVLGRRTIGPVQVDRSLSARNGAAPAEVCNVIG